MIKRVNVVMCDVCGAMGPPSLGVTIPDNWFKSKTNSNVHLCPECSKGLRAAPEGPVRAVHMPGVVKDG